MRWFKLIKIAQSKPIVGPVPLPPVNKLPPGVEVGPVPLPPVNKLPPGVEVGILPLPPVELVGVTPPEIHFGPAWQG
jgi:hypothetical protein